MKADLTGFNGGIHGGGGGGVSNIGGVIVSSVAEFREISGYTSVSAHYELLTNKEVKTSNQVMCLK